MRAFVFFVALLLTLGKAAAETVDGWNVQLFPNSSAPSACLMQSDFRDGTTFGIVVTAKFDWAIALSNASWNLRRGGGTDVAAYVDGRFVAGGRAAHISEKEALLPLMGAKPYRALQDGHGLVLVTPSGRLTFSLQGTEKAMAVTLDCARVLNKRQVTSAQPQGDFQQLSSADAAVVLDRYLKSGGFANYRVAAGDPRGSFATFQLADGTYGYLRAAHGRSTKGADDYAAAVISDLARNCEGVFLSGKDTVPTTDGSVIRIVASTCRLPDRTVALETIVLRSSDGLLVQLTQSAAGERVGATGQSRSQLVDAAIQWTRPK